MQISQGGSIYDALEEQSSGNGMGERNMTITEAIRGSLAMVDLESLNTAK